MSAAKRRGGAPPVVRRIGWYYLALSVLSLYVLVAASNMEVLRWYQGLALPLSLATGIGLLLEQRWAYATAVVYGGVNMTVTLLALVVAVIAPSHVTMVVGGLFALINAALMAPPVLLLGEGCRAWFQRREPAGLPA